MIFNTAAAFLFADDRLSLGVRAEEPRRGRLDVAVGFIEFDESVEEVLRREIREELGVEIQDLRNLASFRTITCTLKSPTRPPNAVKLSVCGRMCTYLIEYTG